MSVSQRHATLEEFLTWPEEQPALEYADGTVTRKVSPQGEHSVLATDFAELVNRFARPDRLARAFVELRTTFGGASHVPDVAIYRWERYPRTPAGRVANRFLIPPDIAVEILSPEQRLSGVARTCRWYVANGALIALLVDPTNETVRVFCPGAEPLILRGDDRLALSEVLPGFVLTVRERFSVLDG